MRLFILMMALGSCITAQSQTAPPDSVLVRLSALEATIINKNARLDWKVVCFLLYAKFEIQRSSDGTNYTTISTFEADQLRCRQPFDFTDTNVSGRLYYRIKVGDLDGRFSTSKIVAVAGKEKSFEINSLTPSLINNTITTLSISSATVDKAEITITNLQGAVVKRISINLNRGVTELQVDVSNLARGNYILTVINRAADIKTIRFAKL
jgi:hypothetical protein